MFFYIRVIGERPVALIRVKLGLLSQECFIFSRRMQTMEQTTVTELLYQG